MSEIIVPVLETRKLKYQTDFTTSLYLFHRRYAYINERAAI